MSDQYTQKLRSLGFSLPEWCLPPTEQLVADFERAFAITLPADYREFLVHHGGVIGSAICRFQEMTPFGPDTYIDTFYGFTIPDRTDNIWEATELIEGAPDVAAIGNNLTGDMFWLMCTGPSAGTVYMHDHQCRSAWTDKEFYEWFPNLAPEIKEYLKMRKQGKLPRKPRGHDHVYVVGRSFHEFIESLQPGEQ